MRSDCGVENERTRAERRQSPGERGGFHVAANSASVEKGSDSGLSRERWQGFLVDWMWTGRERTSGFDLNHSGEDGGIQQTGKLADGRSA